MANEQAITNPGYQKEVLAPFQKVALIRSVVRGLPQSSDLFHVLRLGGIRDVDEESIESTSQGIKTERRSFRPILEHDMTVALATDSLAEVLGLPLTDRQKLVSAGFLHDASKRIEVVMKNYYRVLRQGVTSEEETRIITELLCSTGITNEERSFSMIAEEIKNIDEIGFATYFDEKINFPFLTAAFSSSTSMSEEERTSIITIAKSDSTPAIPLFLSRAAYYTENFPEDDQMREFREIVKALQEKNVLPEIDDSKENYLGMLLLYCDGITQGNTIVGVDVRLDDILKRGAYSELDSAYRSLYGGRSQFDVIRLGLKVTQKFLFAKAKENGFIDEKATSEQLPAILVNNLYKRVTK